MPHLERDGVRIWYETHGEGPPVLLSHGYSASSTMWEPQRGPLADAGYRVVTWDQRGHARSDYPENPADYAEELAVGDMAAVLDAVGARGRRSVETVHWRALADERVTGIGRRLHEQGLLGRVLGPTAAGRRLLRDLRSTVGDGDLVRRVALHGREQVTDPALHAAVFEPPRHPVLPGGGTAPWDLSFADGWQAAHRTRDTLLARYEAGR